MNVHELRRSTLETPAILPALFPKPNTLEGTFEIPCRLSIMPLGNITFKFSGKGDEQPCS